MKLPGQANDYRGYPQRAWIRVRVQSLEDEMLELNAMVDTGSPYGIILGDQVFERFVHRLVKPVESNFGWLIGGWVGISVPGTRFSREVLGYGSNTILRSLHASDRGLDALIGLPLLRMLEYGGDVNRFWIRDASR